MARQDLSIVHRVEVVSKDHSPRTQDVVAFEVNPVSALLSIIASEENPGCEILSNHRMTTDRLNIVHKAVRSQEAMKRIDA